jgi:hypothetical protein
MKKIHSKSSVFLGVTMTGLLTSGCFSSGGGSSSTSATGISTLDALPAATGPVVGGGGSGLVRHFSNLSSTAGTKLSDMGNSVNFGATDSRAFCENSNLIKQVIKEASGPDKILCYISAMKATGIIPSSENVYDGNWHHWALSGMDADGDGNPDPGAPLVKFRITKDSSGKISDFKMYSCFGESGGNPVQSEYISQSFSGSSATVTSKYIGSESTATFGAEVTASGEVNSSGEWISKNLVARNYHNDSGSSFSMFMDMNQYADYITLSGYQKGAFTFDVDFGSGPSSTTFTFDNKMDTYVELINPENLSDLALGHGSSKVDIVMTMTGDLFNYSESFVESWNGDTRQIDLSGPYVANVSSATLMSSSAPSAITFGAGEDWDCDVSSISETVADMNDGNLISTGMGVAMMACEDKFGSGSEWIDCSDVGVPEPE